MNEKQLIKGFKEAVQRMKTDKEGVYFWLLPMEDTENNWAIVLGYSNGFDENEQDEFSDDTWRLCIKLAYQSKNSAMQCDYDLDWDMPYDEISGDVDDTEIAIYNGINLDQVTKWLIDKYRTYQEINK